MTETVRGVVVRHGHANTIIAMSHAFDCRAVDDHMHMRSSSAYRGYSGFVKQGGGT